MADPEIRDLQIATARAYAIAERLAEELERTVADLLDHTDSRHTLRKLADLEEPRLPQPDGGIV